MSKSINDLIKIKDSGFDIAIFPEVRDALAKAFRDIYGNDIDISSASADGQYITSESLIWSKVLECVQSISNKLNPNTSTGKYLDVIASLAGVSRENASYSTCDVYVKWNGSNDSKPNTLTLIDKNAKEWVWLNPLDYNGNTTITFKAGEVKILNFKCREIGNISASGFPISNITDSVWEDVANNPTSYGDIYQTLNVSDFLVLQVDNATVGYDKETDNQLKKKIKRLQASGSDTTIQGLISGLLQVGGIKDVLVVNNTEGNPLTVNVTSTDSVDVPLHNVFVGIRCQDGIHVDPNEIGDVIYRKLTAGVSTKYDDSSITSANTWVYPPDVQETYSTSGTDWVDEDYEDAKKYGKVGEVNPNHSITFPIYMVYNTTIYWYQATTFDKDITIHFKTVGANTTFNTNFKSNNAEYENEQLQYIASTLENYFNNLEMGSNISISEIESIVQSCDYKTRTGLATFITSGGDIGSGGGALKNAPMNFMYFNVHNTYYAGTRSIMIKITEDAVQNDVDGVNYTISILKEAEISS